MPIPLSSKEAAKPKERKPQRLTVKVAFRDGMREWRGYDSCSEWFQIAKSERPGWDVIHVPSGLCKKHCDTITEARLFCGIFGALPVNWENTDAWARWQKKHMYLMPWFRVTGQCMWRIG